MLQLFHLDVAKVNQDVAYVFAMVVYVCCKRLSPMFHLFFQTYVASAFISMLHMFYTYVASVLSGCCACMFLQWFQVFLQVFLHAYLKCFICLQTFVANVSSGCFKSRSGVAAGDPPAAVGVRAGEVKGSRAISVWGQEAQATFGQAWLPRWRAKRSANAAVWMSGALALPLKERSERINQRSK